MRMRRSLPLFTFLGGIGVVPLVNGGELGKLTQEIWSGVAGEQVSSLTSDPRFPTSPTSVSKIYGVEPPQNLADNYGRRLRGWITAPSTGAYTFWIAGDDNCELWLSSDQSTGNKRRIAEVAGIGRWTAYRQFEKYPSQRSAAMDLVAGGKYYVEVLQKEAWGGDHLSLGWQRPDSSFQLIPVSALESYDVVDGDVDQDGLPDNWEQSYGLSVSPGSGAVGHDGTAGDPDGDGFSNRLEWFLQSSPVVHGAIPGGLKREVWTGKAGGTISAWIGQAAFLQAPQINDFLPGAAAPINFAENYGQRLRGYVTIPSAGTYRFAVAGDDECELWLGGDGSPFSKRLGAFIHGGWTAPEEWTRFPTQQSGDHVLAAGQVVYVEILHKEGVNGDSVALGWSCNGAAIERIPAAHLSAYALLSTDQDDDGFPDSWESSVGLDPSDNGSGDPLQAATADPDGDGLSNFEEYLDQSDPFEAGGNAGLYRREIWTGVAGATLDHLTLTEKFCESPAVSTMVEGPLKLGSYDRSYGQRLKGALVAPHTGNYRFWIASDDEAEFWLSTTGSRLQKRKIAYNIGSNSPDDFDVTPSQKSVLIPLVADEPYYYEVLHKNATNGDHLSVAWNYEAPNWTRQPGAIASQSSNFWSETFNRYEVASAAIDGDMSSANISRTENLEDSWWQVDLGQVRPINRVVLTNRNVDQNTLSNFRISVLNPQGAEVAGQNFFEGSGSVGDSLTWTLAATVMGSTVKIELLDYNNAGNGYLALAEVQVFDWKPLLDRQVVSADWLVSEASEPLDLDGDSLPDTWETGFGLLDSDNGAGDFANGEYGDPDQDGVPNLHEYINGTSPVVANGEPGRLLREIWTRLSMPTIFEFVRDPAYLESPQSRSTTSKWPGIDDENSYYGQRLRGTLTAPVSGWYTFWIAGDDDCELFLSANNRKFFKQSIASTGGGDFSFVSYASGPGDYDRYPLQKSKPIYLTAETEYFIEALHKEVIGGWMTVAWQKPGGFRELVPFSQLRSFTYDIDDADDDDLPDSWESPSGLDPLDNGSVRRGIEGALGDADSDQLTNHEEFLLGTNPLSADSDMDGINDFVEARSLGSDPNDGESGIGTGAPHADLNGSQGIPVTGNWIPGPNGTLLSLDRRGAASWEFTLTSPGAKLLEVLAIPQGNTWAGNPLSIEITVLRPSDSKRWNIGTFPLRDDEGQPTTVLTLLPWLPVGPYRAEIAICNVSESRNVRIDRVRVTDPVGEDANQNGVADWIEARLGASNGLLTTTGSSQVSPVCLEGIARDTGTANLLISGQAVPVIPGTDDRWFYNLALPADGSAQVFASRFENNWIQQSHAVSWAPTNILAGGTLTVRVGDSLRLTAFPGASADNGNVMITGLGEPILTPANLPEVHSFPTAGNFTLSATHTAANGTQTSGTFSVKVIAASFGPDLLVRSERWRNWYTQVPATLPIEWDSKLSVSQLAPDHGKYRLNIAAFSNKPLNLIARSQLAGSVAAKGTVDPFLIGDPYETGYVEILDTLADGTIYGRVSVVADRLPPGGFVEIQIWAGGAHFADGTTLKNLYATAFDANGVAYVDVYYPSNAAVSSFCAYYRLKDANGVLLSGY